MEFKNIKSIQLKDSSLIIESEDGGIFAFKPYLIFEKDKDGKIRSKKSKPFEDIMSSIENIGEEIGEELFNVTLSATEKVSEVKTKFLEKIKNWIDEELKSKK